MKSLRIANEINARLLALARRSVPPTLSGQSLAELILSRALDRVEETVISHPTVSTADAVSALFPHD